MQRVFLVSQLCSRYCVGSYHRFHKKKSSNCIPYIFYYHWPKILVWKLLLWNPSSTFGVKVYNIQMRTRGEKTWYLHVKPNNGDVSTLRFFNLFLVRRCLCPFMSWLLLFSSVLIRVVDPGGVDPDQSTISIFLTRFTIRPMKWNPDPT